MKKINIVLLVTMFLVSGNVMSQWTSVGEGLDNTVITLTPFNNQLIATGNFEHSGTNAVYRLGFWNGNQWTGSAVTPPTDIIKALCIHDDTLYASTENGLYRMDGQNWSEIVTYQTQTAHSLMQSYKGYLYLFTDWIVYRLENGNLVNIGEVNNPVYTTCIFNDTLFCGGCFSGVGSVASPHIIKFDGTQWHAVIPNLDFSSSVLAMAVFDNILFVGGEISTYNGDPGDWLLEYNGTSLVQSSLHPNGRVNTLLSCNNKLFITGNTSAINGVTVDGIAVWDGTTIKNISMGNSPTIYTMAEFDGETYMGGDLGFSGAQFIAKYDATASIFKPVSGISGEPLIFPNPVASTSIIRFPEGHSTWNVQIFDNSGKCVITDAGNTTGYFSVSASELSEGVYMFRLLSDDGTVRTGKFTVCD